MEHEQVSLNTLYGRVVAQLELGSFQRRCLYDVTWKIGGAELVRRQSSWYLCVTQSKELPEPEEPLGVIGIDLGIVALATSSDGIMFCGKHIAKVRERYHKRRRRLQAVGTKSAKRRLKQISGRESRFQKDVNHCLSKQLVTKAANERKALALEELRHIRKRATVQHSQRRRFSSWAFRQLRHFVTYKAAWAGVLIIMVDPRNTSRTCAVCGHCESRNRKSQFLFVCLKCGYVAVADINAALNIRERAAVNLPMVARATPVAANSRL